MTSFIDYLLMIGVSITIFNVFSQNERWINFVFLVLIGIYYLSKYYKNVISTLSAQTKKEDEGK